MPDWLPYCGTAPVPSALWLRWNFDYGLLLALAIFGAHWWRTTEQLRKRRRPMCCAVAVFLLLFVSPFCALGSALFTARVVHHVLLATVLAPLLVAAFGTRRWQTGISLPLMTAAQAAILWAWHAPQLYEAALSSDAIFWTMQISITVSSACWWAELRRSEPIAAVAALLATMVQMGVLGALLTFAGRAFYAPHTFGAVAWGFTPLEDQQIAGLVMWAPASAIYLMVATVTLYRFLTPQPAK